MKSLRQSHRSPLSHSLLAGLAVSVSACLNLNAQENTATAPVIYPVTKTELGPAPAPEKIIAKAVSLIPGGCRAALIVTAGNQMQVVVEGKAGPPYDKVFDDSLHFSPDGQRLAYAGKTGDQRFVSIDGAISGPYDGVLKDSPVFSPDSKRVAYSFLKGGRQYVSLDGVIQPPSDGVANDSLQFDPTSQRFAYVLVQNHLWQVMMDGHAGPEFADFSPTCGPIFSADGRHSAYLAFNPGHAVLVVDNDIKSLGDLRPFSLKYSSNQKYLSFIAKDNQGVFQVYINDRAGPLQWGVLTGTPLYSPDGKHVFYAFWNAMAFQPVVDEVVGSFPESDYEKLEPNSVAFSPDSKVLAFIGYHHGILSRGSNELTGQTDAAFGSFTDDKYHLVTTQVERPPEADFKSLVGVEDLPFDGHYVNDSLRFSPDSKRLAFIAENEGRQTLFINHESRPVDGIYLPDSLILTGDSDVAYAAHNAIEQWVVMNGARGPAFAAIVAGPVARQDGQCEYLAIEKSGEAYKLVRVAASWPPLGTQSNSTAKP